MIRFLKCLLVSVCFISAVFAQVSPQDARTKEQLIAFVKKAVEMTKADQASAFTKFNAPEVGKPPVYVDGELYIYAYDYTGKVLAHGANPALIGVDLSQKKDPKNGSFTIQNLMNEAKKPAKNGFVEFFWPHPKDMTKVLKKIGYVENVDGKVWLGSGIYLSDEKK
jgi:cytochrome c